jgi:hypothetical protein
MRQNGHDPTLSAPGQEELVPAALLHGRFQLPARRVAGLPHAATRGDLQAVGGKEAACRLALAASFGRTVASPAAAPPCPDALLACEWDVTRLFGQCDIARRGLKAGWACPEEDHTWNEGIDATLALAVEDGCGAATLVIDGEPYVTHQQPTQDMTVTVNGHFAAFWRMTERGGRTLRIGIEPEWWVIRHGRPVLNVGFHLPDSVRPIDIGDGQDGRAIGFCFRTLLVNRAEVS